MKSQAIYSTAVKKTKSQGFLKFLENIGFSSDDILARHSRGEYFCLDINISARPNIRSILNLHQVEFL